MYRWFLWTIAVLLAVALAGCGRPDQNGPPIQSQDETIPEHGHMHDESLVEWSGVYQLEAGTYSLVFGESGHDPSILIAFLDESNYLEAGDDSVAHHTALHLMETAPSLETPGARLVVADQACYNLTLEPDGTVYELDVPEPGAYIMFTEHFAWEFDMQIVDADNAVVEAGNVREYAEPHNH